MPAPTISIVVMLRAPRHQNDTKTDDEHTNPADGRDVFVKDPPGSQETKDNSQANEWVGIAERYTADEDEPEEGSASIHEQSTKDIRRCRHSPDCHWNRRCVELHGAKLEHALFEQ